MKHLVLILLMYGSIDLLECGLISKSIIEHCTKDASEPKAKTGKPCSRKFVVSVTLKSGQVR